MKLKRVNHMVESAVYYFPLQGHALTLPVCSYALSSWSRNIWNLALACTPSLWLATANCCILLQSDDD
jgi:hypothetical protein